MCMHASPIPTRSPDKSIVLNSARVRMHSAPISPGEPQPPEAGEGPALVLKDVPGFCSPNPSPPSNPPYGQGQKPKLTPRPAARWSLGGHCPQSWLHTRGKSKWVPRGVRIGPWNQAKEGLLIRWGQKRVNGAGLSCSPGKGTYLQGWPLAGVQELGVAPIP